MSLLLLKSRNLDYWFSSDKRFNHLYPYDIQQLAQRHWTPLSIARKAIQFLASEEDVRILDIGSGVGKFCLAAGYYKPNARIYGIEQRKKLVEYAEDAGNTLELSNVSFSCGNFTQINLKLYDHFYLYNPFFENLDETDKIDNTIMYSKSLYDYYSQYLNKQLETMPSGTRVVSFCSWHDEIPPCYQLVESQIDELLKFWVMR
jgi:SAM-dependent methyltransferase